MIPVNWAKFVKFAQFHGIRTRIELVKLDPRGRDDTKVVILVFDPNRAHDTIAAGRFALNVKRLLGVAVMDNSNLVRADYARMNERRRKAHLQGVAQKIVRMYD
jgi:hypothetical protein